jgi:hypothetical protein
MIGVNLMYDDEQRVRFSKVIVEGAGTPDVNGEYLFFSFRANAGFYQRFGSYKGNPDRRFTLYKCSLRNGGFQWFISITPHNQDPGTNQDVDFYFSHARPADFLPPSQWYVLNQSPVGFEPAPRVKYVPLTATPHDDDLEDDDAPDLEDDESESDQGSGMIGDEALYADQALDSFDDINA